jgi:hypothetical protein
MAITESTSPVFLPRQTRWVVGVDLGQSSDPTAIAVLEHVKGVLDPNSEIERHTGTGQLPQTPAERTYVRHLQRLPLGLSYPAQCQIVKDLMARPPLNGDGRTPPATLVIDNSGVGRAVSDVFSEAGLRHQAVTITAGSEVASAGLDRWHVSKTHLISTVDAMLHTGTLRFAAALTEAGAMREELKDFRRKLSDAGRATYAARTGAHDDLVLAVAIACWWISRPPPATAAFGRYETAATREEHRAFWFGEPKREGFTAKTTWKGKGD